MWVRTIYTPGREKRSNIVKLKHWTVFIFFCKLFVKIFLSSLYRGFCNLGVIKIFFLSFFWGWAGGRRGFCGMILCSFFCHQWNWSFPKNVIFAQSLSYCWGITLALNWGLWGTVPLDLVLGLLVATWMSRWCAPGVNSVGLSISKCWLSL